MNRLLMQAIIDLAAFLELSGEDVLSQDAAVSQLEGLSFTLRNLKPEERKMFATYIEEVFNIEQQAGSNNERSRFLASLSESLGLTD